MVAVFFCLFSYVQPSDTNVYGQVNANIAQFSRYWEYVYETSSSGFRTSQGCLDHSGWYQLYELKTQAKFTSNFSLRYSFQMLRHYEDTITDHRFEPTLRLYKNLYAHMLIIPYYKKYHNELGLGLSWRDENHNWLAVYGIAKKFDHNFSLIPFKPGPQRDPFERIPLELELDARYATDWLRFRLHADIDAPSHQYLDWPDSLWQVWEKDRDSSAAWTRLEVSPYKNIWLGARASWRRERTLTRWPARGEVYFDTLKNVWFEPFIAISPTQNLEFSFFYRLWDVSREMDSVTYYSDSDIFSCFARWQPLDYLVCETGYQRSKRERFNNGNPIGEPFRGRHGSVQSRLVFSLEFRLKSGIMFFIKEGLEMDRFPELTLRAPHNHTYVMIYMPLVLKAKKAID